MYTKMKKRILLSHHGTEVGANTEKSVRLYSQNHGTSTWNPIQSLELTNEEAEKLFIKKSDMDRASAIMKRVMPVHNH